MTAKFEYYNKSTDNIIGVPLLIVSGTVVDTVPGITRTNLGGEITASKPIINEYGVQKEHLQFTYSLMKSDDTDFTVQEQVAVESWLTSPRFSSELKITDCTGDSYSYFGKFITTEWTVGVNGFILCTFTFQVNGSYAYVYEKYNYSNVDASGYSSTTRFVINCKTNEYEEYVYPEFKVTGKIRSSTSSFKLTNVTDDNKFMQVTTSRSLVTFVIDCQRCMVREYMQGINHQVDLDIVKYKDLGWGDVGDIYWLRLLPGNNTLVLEGDVALEISYYAPYKKVGGWLI